MSRDAQTNKLGLYLILGGIAAGLTCALAGGVFWLAFRRPPQTQESERAKQARELGEQIERNKKLQPNGTMADALSGGALTDEQFAEKVRTGEIEYNSLPDATKELVDGIWAKQKK